MLKKGLNNIVTRFRARFFTITIASILIAIIGFRIQAVEQFNNTLVNSTVPVDQSNDGEAIDEQNVDTDILCDFTKFNYDGSGDLYGDNQFLFKNYWLNEDIEADINSDEKIDRNDLICYARAYGILEFNAAEGRRSYYPYDIISPDIRSEIGKNIRLKVKTDEFVEGGKYMLYIVGFGEHLKSESNATTNIADDEIIYDPTSKTFTVDLKLRINVHDNVFMQFCRKIEENNVACGKPIVYSVHKDYDIISPKENEEISSSTHFIAKINGPEPNDIVNFVIQKDNNINSSNSVIATWNEREKYWNAKMDLTKYENGNYTFYVRYYIEDEINISGRIPIVLNNTNGDSIVNNNTNVSVPINVNLSVVDKIKYSGADPRVEGVESIEDLKVIEVTTRSVIAQNVNDSPALKFSGTGPPNTKLTLYIYSDSPLIVQVDSDESGNWTYTLEEPLHDGQHVVYVTITDETGKIEKKSSPLQFFVKEAKSITEEEFLSSNLTVGDKSNTALKSYVLIAISIVGLVVLSYMVIKMKKA